MELKSSLKAESVIQLAAEVRFSAEGLTADTEVWGSHVKGPKSNTQGLGVTLADHQQAVKTLLFQLQGTGIFQNQE